MNNVEPRKSKESELPLEDGSVDGVLIAFVAHEVDEPHAFIREISRFSKSRAFLSFGPPMDERLEPQEVDGWASDVGLKKGRVWSWSKAIVGWEYLRM